MSRHGNQSQDFELNLAPIIDCFTVLVTFLLASSAFISIGLLDAGIAAGGATTPEDKAPPSVQVSVELQPSHKIEIKVTGKANQTFDIVPTNGVWDYDKLTAQLNTLKQKYPDLGGVTLKADENVQYGEVIVGMENIRKSLPAVLLGGF